MGDVILAGIAAANAINAYNMARKQLKLLKQQVRLSKVYLEYYELQRQFYRNVFQDNVETRIRMFSESSIFTPDYHAAYGTALNFGNDRQLRYQYLTLGRGAAVPQLSYYARRGQMYSLPGFVDVQSFNYVSQAISMHRVDLFAHLYRYEEYRENIYSQRRFERYSAIATYGNKSAMTIAAEGTSSFAYLNQALEAKGNMYGAAANDLFSFAGDAYQSGQGKKRVADAFAAPKVGSMNAGGMAESYSRRQEQNVMNPTWSSHTGPMYK